MFRQGQTSPATGSTGRSCPPSDPASDGLLHLDREAGACPSRATVQWALASAQRACPRNTICLSNEGSSTWCDHPVCESGGQGKAIFNAHAAVEVEVAPAQQPRFGYLNRIHVEDSWDTASAAKTAKWAENPAGTPSLFHHHEDEPGALCDCCYRDAYHGGASKLQDGLYALQDRQHQRKAGDWLHQC